MTESRLTRNLAVSLWGSETLKERSEALSFFHKGWDDIVPPSSHHPPSMVFRIPRDSSANHIVSPLFENALKECVSLNATDFPTIRTQM
ncbi:hypothetical protein AVEN_160262-1 [Araneus ventricosus]|uniref:Uncharacterized protein n=1 Tax=Araneus ventricosus TaxID=182803 RepID=A0A4Y2L864_ARAVE|nr:hypothetical protein AVEN_160262-1 [Araneus ventricosus]